MNIKTDELLELLYVPMNDEKMINIIHKLGLEQPIITEEYESTGKISVSNKKITLVFKEINGLSKDGDPILVKIDFEDYQWLDYPYHLAPSDSYIDVCTKLNKKADFVNKKRLKEAKIWVKLINNVDTSIIVHFTDIKFKNINYIIINKFDKDRVGKYIIQNED